MTWLAVIVVPLVLPGARTVSPFLTAPAEAGLPLCCAAADRDEGDNRDGCGTDVDVPRDLAGCPAPARNGRLGQLLTRRWLLLAHRIVLSLADELISRD
jgi:hypothetical protein